MYMSLTKCLQRQKFNLYSNLIVIHFNFMCDNLLPNINISLKIPNIQNESEQHICNNTADQCAQCKRKFAFYRRQVCTIIFNIIRSACMAALISCIAFSCSISAKDV